MGGAWAAWADEEADRIRSEGRWRSIRDVAGPEPATAVAGPGGGDRAVVSFASNDYLGLTRHPAVVGAAQAALARWGTGAGSARLVAGGRSVHRDLEEELAAWKGTEAAVLFPTGYAANLGVLQALGGPGVTVVSDELNHASIVDGCRLSRSSVVVTPHADAAAVERAVAAAGPGRVLVVTESVFSMDGDVAPVDDLVDLCGRHDALLVVDEAHAVLGPDVDPRRGAGPVLRVGTLSKALAALGGFAAGPAGLCALLVNRARPFVFTTASTPADTAAALAALGVLRSAEGGARRARLRDHVARLLPSHPSPVVPVPVGGDAEAVAAAGALLDRGFLVPAIRPPTVPVGTARLRVSLSAAHTTDQVEELAAALRDLGLRPHSRGNRVRHPGPVASGVVGPGPARVVLVLGTGTGVGKTWVAARLAEALRAGGTAVAARKPVQSFEPGEGPTDADVLAAASGETPSAVCPDHRWYGAAMAPPLAAAALGRPAFTLADLLAELAWPSDTEVGLVEGVGGPRSPVAAGADNVDLARALRPDAIVLVAGAGLGAINAVRLAAAVLPRPPVVFLNRLDPADPVHAGNRDWLEGHAGLTVVTSIADLHPLSSK